MTHDDELIDRVRKTLNEKAAALRVLDASPDMVWSTLARAAVDAIRSYDAERWQNGGTLDPASLTALAPDVATRETLWPVTEADVAAAQTEIAVAMLADRIRHPAGEELEWARREAAALGLAERYDPDDYRDLPVAMTGPVRFRGGLTTEKRK